MSLKDHKDYAAEMEYLMQAVQIAKEMLVGSISSKRRIRGETRQAFMNYDIRDGSGVYEEIMSYAVQFSRTIKNINRVKYAIGKPYFARIDYKDDKLDETEKLYIGKMGLFNSDDKPVVVDWRAPISSIYYDGRLGEVEYQSLDGTESGQMLLKRQYSIENSELLDIMDVDITTTDTFLQAALGESKDNRLKDIVTTIQAEQNTIIRQDIGTPLIVQGVAGSGKTTIALHRIAYLIYTYEKTFDPSEFLILAPSKLFLNYISEVLPELGADQVKQSTFAEISKELMDFDVNILGSDFKLSAYLENTKLTPKDRMDIIKVSRFKGSMGFQGILKRYCDYIKSIFLPAGDFEFMGNIIMSHGEIKTLVMETLSYMPLYRRKQELEKILKSKLKDAYPLIYEKTEGYYDSQIARNRATITDITQLRRRNTYLIDKRDAILAEMTKKRKTAVTAYLKEYPSKKPVEWYIELMETPELFLNLAGGEKYQQGIELICDYTRRYISRKTIDIDDLAAILYLHYELYGFWDKDLYRYVVIDEAQDFSLFQLWILKTVFNTERFTLVGDLAQGIYLNGSYKSWNTVAETVFRKREAAYLTLEQSYRTTIEIMNFANEIIKMLNNNELALAKPVVRHGQKPKIYRPQTQEKGVKTVYDIVQRFKSEGNKSITIICKTEKSVNLLWKKLSAYKDLELRKVTADGDLAMGEIIILPAYMAKGLEFDAVILAEMFDDYSPERELDLKLLYVSSTRALHAMAVVAPMDKMNLLEWVDKDTYEMGQ